MSQAALWKVMLLHVFPDVDLLDSLYEHSTVRMALNDQQCATITFDTGWCPMINSVRRLPSIQGENFPETIRNSIRHHAETEVDDNNPAE